MADTEYTVICKSCGYRWEYGEADACAHCGFEVAFLASDGRQILPELKPKAAKK